MWQYLCDRTYLICLHTGVALMEGPARETLPKGGGLRPSPFGRVSRAPGPPRLKKFKISGLIGPPAISVTPVCRQMSTWAGPGSLRFYRFLAFGFWRPEFTSLGLTVSSCSWSSRGLLHLCGRLVQSLSFCRARVCCFHFSKGCARFLHLYSFCGFPRRSYLAV